MSTGEKDTTTNNNNTDINNNNDEQSSSFTYKVKNVKLSSQDTKNYAQFVFIVILILGFGYIIFTIETSSKIDVERDQFTKQRDTQLLALLVNFSHTNSELNEAIISLANDNREDIIYTKYNVSSMVYTLEEINDTLSSIEKELSVVLLPK